MAAVGPRVEVSDSSAVLWLPWPLVACLLLRDTLGPRSSIWPIAAMAALTWVLARRAASFDVRLTWATARRAGWWLLGGVALSGILHLWPQTNPTQFDAFWLALCVPVVEEQYFRGLVWDVVARDGGDRRAWLVAALLFVVAHLGAMPPWEAAVMGLSFGAARCLGGSVWCAVGLHMGWNGGVVVGPPTALLGVLVVLSGCWGVGHGDTRRMEHPRRG